MQNADQVVAALKIGVLKSDMVAWNMTSDKLFNLNVIQQLHRAGMHTEVDKAANRLIVRGDGSSEQD